MNSTIQNKLLPDEEILWRGQPKSRKSVYFDIRTGCSPILFAIVWLCFSVFWTVMAFIGTRGAISSGGTGSIMAIIFPLFGLPFIAIGVFLLYGAFKGKNNYSKATHYYVTNKRIIINIDTYKSPVFTSVFIHNLKGIRTIRNRDNTGNIIFENHFMNRTYSSSSYSTSNVMPSVGNCFYRIADVDDVYKLILMQQEILQLKEKS